ncbi:MAG: hypothetical protein LEGION0398_MBIBDBAK_00172 [Legionellaceae bacterium]
MKWSMVVLLSFLFSFHAMAEEKETSSVHVIGTYGDFYPITEDDFLSVIEQGLKKRQANGEIEKINQAFEARAKAHSIRPVSVLGLTETKKPRQFLFDPSITLTHDILDTTGKVVAKKGTQVNPLNLVHLSKALLFFDGDKKSHVEWAKKKILELKGNVKLILVNGAVDVAVKQQQKPVYFDQEGRLTTRFGITHVPAIVKQEGQLLKVREVTP